MNGFTPGAAPSGGQGGRGAALRELRYRISFNTPAFLGNADQQAQWRTPQIKALLRQWWRVVKARELGEGLSVAALRQAEARLFGGAAQGTAGAAAPSQLRIRLDAWGEGGLRQWPAEEPREFHPEMRRAVGAELYLGYGPLGYDRGLRQAALSGGRGGSARRSAIEDCACNGLRLRLPAWAAAEVEATLCLAQWFGTLGARSRNAWGSVHLEATQGTDLPPLSAAALRPWLRPLPSCLELDWPHAIGADARGPLVWLTPARASWRRVMKDLARLKIAWRTQAAPFPHERPGGLARRHLLSIPVTNHEIRMPGWERGNRLSSQLRFKLQRAEGGRLRGVIVHLPCSVPAPLCGPLRERMPDELALWQDVHRVLDALDHLVRRLD